MIGLRVDVDAIMSLLTGSYTDASAIMSAEEA